MRRGKVITVAVVLVGVGLTGCSASQPHPSTQARAEPAKVTAPTKASRPDLRKAGLHSLPAAIPAPMKLAGKDEIPRIAAADDRRPAKPTIRF